MTSLNLTNLAWTLGRLGLARWELLAIPAASVLLGLVLLLGMAHLLNAFMAGEQTAVTLGLNARTVRLRVFLIASLMTRVLVSISGSIGFSGLRHDAQTLKNPFNVNH